MKKKAYEQELGRRLHRRLNDSTKRWKLSPIDLESRMRWVEYSEAKDMMFAHADVEEAPWYVVESDDKRAARLNCIAHLLDLIPYREVGMPDIELQPRPAGKDYVRPPREDQNYVPEVFT